MQNGEKVDVVDKDDKVLYSVSKKKAHERGLLHRTVIAEVKNTKGEWFLVRQSLHKQDAGQYVSPVGGHVQAGESAADALKREAAEECGLRDFRYKFVGKIVFNRTVIGRHENHLFILFEIYTDQQELRLNDESDEYRVFSEAELKKEIKENPKQFGDAFYPLLKNFYSHLLST